MTRYNRYFADVSSAQPDISMSNYAEAGHLLIAIKATEGTTYVNPYHRGQALAAGGKHVAVVHYHYARPDLDNAPNDEAEHFLSAALPLAGPYDYLVLDFERGIPPVTPRDPSWTAGFDLYVRAHSRFRTILYATRSTLQQSDAWLPEAPRRVWDADWSEDAAYAPEGYEWAFRQYTDGVMGPRPHTFAGIGECDGSYMTQAMFNHLTQYRR